jgi:drug/metabolite transporter (DMT)-like permease
MSSPFGFALLALAIMLEIAGQLFFKAGLLGRPDNSRAAIQGRPANDSNLLIAAGIMVYVAELVVWVAALSSLRLSQAFPLLSLSYAGVAIAAWLLFGEKPRTRSIIGIVLVTAGAALMVA